MHSRSELECLDYRELQKLAKSRNIRPFGKGVTKKRLVSLLWSSLGGAAMDECLNSSGTDSSSPLPLQEVPLETILPILSPKVEHFAERKSFNIDELNDSNKENNTLRRLTFDVVQPQPKEENSVTPALVNNKRDKTMKKIAKKVTIIKTPTNIIPEEVCTPKPAMKIVKTPAATRGATLRSFALSQKLKTPVNKTPGSTLKTPGTTRSVALRLALSAKKIEFSKVQSKIPKLSAKKLPNFANIHQNAFEKMDSLWDVERQRELRKRQTMNAKKLAPVVKIPDKSQKKIPVKAPVKKQGLVKDAPMLTTNIPRKASPGKKSTSTNKSGLKETARQAVTKTKPQTKVSAKDEQRTFLKGVRINRRFEMQMKNRGLI